MVNESRVLKKFFLKVVRKRKRREKKLPIPGYSLCHLRQGFMKTGYQGQVINLSFFSTFISLEEITSTAQMSHLAEHNTSQES